MQAVKFIALIAWLAIAVFVVFPYIGWWSLVIVGLVVLLGFAAKRNNGANRIHTHTDHGHEVSRHHQQAAQRAHDDASRHHQHAVHQHQHFHNHC